MHAEQELPSGWASIGLDTFLRGRGETVNPSAHPDDRFVLYSVPAHATGKPEICFGRSIGSAKQAIASGTVLLCKINPRINRVWTVADHGAGARLIASTEWIAFPRNRAILPDYLRLFLTREAVRSHLAANVSGVGGSLMRVNSAVMATIQVPLAPLPEQVRIVTEVEALFAEVEAGEAVLTRAREGLMQFRASLLHAACTGALTAEWRAANPTNETGNDLLADILRQRRTAWENDYRRRRLRKDKAPDGGTWKTRYPVPRPADTQGLPELSAGWTWASLDQLAYAMTSGSRAWAPYYNRGSSVFIMAQNVRPGRFDRSFVQHVDPPSDDPERERTRVQMDDLLVTIVGANTGDVCRVDVPVQDHYVCQSVALIRPVCADLASYIELFLNAEQGGRAAFARMMYGAGRPHLSFDQLRSVAIPLPPAAEVRAIMAAVEDVNADLSGIKLGDFDFAALRQSILHAAFTGRLVPQDPSEEPAAALLVRLRSAPTTPRRPCRRTPEEAFA